MLLCAEAKCTPEKQLGKKPGTQVFTGFLASTHDQPCAPFLRLMQVLAHFTVMLVGRNAETGSPQATFIRRAEWDAAKKSVKW
jgi:hypothetical protein